MSYTWTDWQPATCRPDHCFCEAIRSGAIAQPADTWSNLGFVLVGLLIAHARIGRDLATQYDNPMIRDAVYRRLYGYALVLIGLGSAFYHASLTFIGQLMDVSGMYVLITFALLYSLARTHKQSHFRFIATYVGITAVLFAMQTTLPSLRRYVFGLLVIGLLGTETYLRRKALTSIESKWLWWAAGIMAVAFAIWVLDITKTVCAPYSIFQGHAVWHLLGAVSSFCLYRYYRSEMAGSAAIIPLATRTSRIAM
jgi:Ceramidase